jgi:type IV secretory pathway TrbF-like protein
MAALPDTPMYNDQTTVAVNWWLIRSTVAGWAIAIVLAISLAVVATQRPAPYVFPVNSLGQPVGMVYPVTSVQAIPDLILRARLANFIHDAFTIDSFPDEEKYLMDNAAAMLTGQAFNELNGWYHRDKDKHFPGTVYYKETQEVHVLRTLKLPARDTFEVDYLLTNHQNNNQTLKQSSWRAVMHLIVGHSDDPESMDLFIDSLDFKPEVME